ILSRPVAQGGELWSATGLRNYFSLQVSRLIYDQGYLQVFSLRGQFHPAVEEVDLEPMLTETARRTLAEGQGPPTLELFQEGLTEPGDYEVVWELDEGRIVSLRLYLELSSGDKRAFRLRSYRPFIPGPQRLRFVLPAGETINISVTADGPEGWKGVRQVRLFRVRAAGPGAVDSPSAAGRRGEVKEGES
ncbi:MAG: hypothetical protein AB1896_07155, partial [Thermodesulfobacteriota bacterium]